MTNTRCRNCGSGEYEWMGDGVGGCSGQILCKNCDHQGNPKDPFESARKARRMARSTGADQSEWAEGWDPQMEVNDEGHYVSKNPKYPFWNPDAKDENGEPVEIRLLQPDNIAECIDNLGMEDQFDQGIDYIFIGRPDGEMITVFDKLGEERECFSERFRVKSLEIPELVTHYVKAPAEPGDLPEVNPEELECFQRDPETEASLQDLFTMGHR